MAGKPIPIEQRFWKKVAKGKPDECWAWLGSRHPVGYGKTSVGRKTLYAHRVAYELNAGLPVGSLELHIRHTCDNPNCVNPSHLIVGTAQDNANDKVSRGRSLFGSKHNLTHLTDADVIYIRTSSEKGVDLARKFNVLKATISNIRTGKSWKHLLTAEDD